MAEWTERAELLFKKEGLTNLQNANVLVVGLGGVGSFAAEFLARAGVGTMTIVDGDVVGLRILTDNYLLHSGSRTT
jgi:tRNA A37 threonylcarbamoyladenosine dehydratase